VLNVLVLYCNVLCIDKPATLNAYNGEQLYGEQLLRKPRSFYSKRIFSFPIFSLQSRNSHLIIDAVSLWFSEPLDTKQAISQFQIASGFHSIKLSPTS